ncbi:MAG: ferritin-like domain-containing protein [Gammaproteobacteria bacterium]|nr:ferritin-like domain-containing protein [Gammaproteobacteria bacterium]
MKAHWQLSDLHWDAVAPATVGPELLQTIKTAALIEANSADYVAYLRNVFAGDDDFTQAAEQWGIEEAQHGRALGRWAELVDPGFDFAAALARFRAGYRVPIDVQQSVRGSRTGELVARCVVESGTCSFYSALRDAAPDPVLRDICHRIAQDEAQHFRLFKQHLERYQRREPLRRWTRARIALGRIFETSDDELSYAYYSANVPAHTAYDRVRHGTAYWRRAMSFYAERHLQGAAHMVTLAIGSARLSRHTRRLGRLLYLVTRWRLRRLEAAGAA